MVSSPNSDNQKLLIALFIFLILFALILIVTSPFPQDPDYHLLADTKQRFAIPNFADVVSNLPFALIGLFGLTLSTCKSTKIIMSWLAFFCGIALVAIGSSYYHWQPNNQSLVWDRLPMTISFMSLFVALLAEHVSSRLEKPLLPITILVGLSSVIYWHFTDDLRFYAFIQFSTLAAIPVLLSLKKSSYTHRHYLLYGLFCYVLAKLFELNDQNVFDLTGRLISGHTIKHLFAAAGTYCVYLMLLKRKKKSIAK